MINKKFIPISEEQLAVFPRCKLCTVSLLERYTFVDGVCEVCLDD